MKEKYKDTDLREALQRKYADTPKLPDDFMESMKLRTEEQTKTRPMPAVKRWRWAAVAACLLLITGIGLTFMPTDRQGQTATKAIAKAGPNLQQTTTNLKTTVESTVAQSLPSVHRDLQSRCWPDYKSGQTGKRKEECLKDGVGPTANISGSVNQAPPLPQLPTTNSANKTSSSANIQHLTPSTQLCYATHKLSEDTIPYQDPARVDDFIAKMAAYNKVKEGELTCEASAGSNVASTVYVFPDNQEIDLFSRLLQVACRYSDKTPGYHLNFSHQQFFFELKDMRHQLQYRWIAERINGTILLYSTHAPIGEEVSSACYQEYRDELMHTKSMNIKTRDI